MVPIDYDTVLFMDLSFILEDPSLKEAFERQGILDALGPAAGPIQEQVDALVLAQRGAGALGVLRGSLDAESLINSLKAPNAEVESESYAGFEILKVVLTFPFFTLDIPVSFLNDTTAIFAVSFSPESPSIDAVKAALDTVEGSKPGYLSDPPVKQLIGSVPQGFSMVVTRNCGPPDGPEGCEGSAISQVKEGENVISHMVFGFSSPAMARAARPAIKEEILKDLREPLELLEVAQEGNLVRVRGRGDISTAILGFGD